MSRVKRVTLGVAVMVLSSTAIGCDEKVSDLTGPTPNLEPTFASIQRDIFSATDASGRAACVQCHSDQGRAPAAGLVLLEGRAHGALVNQPSSGKPDAIRVIPGDPDNSYLVQKLEGAPGIVGERMPRTSGPFLTEGQMLVIREWIARGAPNN